MSSAASLNLGWSQNSILENGLKIFLCFLHLVCQEKKEVFLWSVEEAKQLRAVQAPGQCTEAYFCMDNNWVALEKDKFIRVEDVHTGFIIMLQLLIFTMFDAWLPSFSPFPTEEYSLKTITILN